MGIQTAESMYKDPNGLSFMDRMNNYWGNQNNQMPEKPSSYNGSYNQIPGGQSTMIPGGGATDPAQGGYGGQGFNPYAYGGRGRQNDGNQRGNGGLMRLMQAMRFRPPPNMQALGTHNYSGGS
jgi:hypothetical protein